MRPILTLLFALLCTSGFAQNYAPVKTNWKDAGYRGTKPVFTQTINVLNFGADATGANTSSAALASAIAALNGAPGVIYFPAGNYLLTSAVVIGRDSIVFRGAGSDQTRLRFSLGGSATSLFQVNGATTGDTALLTATVARGNTTVAVSNAGAFRAGDWVTIGMNDQGLMTSTWAYGSAGQLVQVQSINGNSITFSSPMRLDYVLPNRPLLRRQQPRNNIGFECLSLQRLDATASQASNIVFENAVNCWVNGIESDSANFAHIEVNHSSNIEITGSYFHHAFSYGGNGQGYGVLLQFSSNECKVEANYFDHLRHSMLLQAGANGNVLAYNYSIHPYWTEPALPDSSAGEIVLHGNYPFMNLAEGNFIRNIVIDDSHGRNGPLNTFFRNRAEGYGIFMNFSPATDSVQFIGNEITNTAIGLNFIQGTGHLQYGNNYRGVITGGNGNIPDTSLYLPAGQKPPCPGGYDSWPVVGRPEAYNTGTIYAKARVRAGKPASCACATVPSTVQVRGVSAAAPADIFPNPAKADVVIRGEQADQVTVYSMTGAVVRQFDRPQANRIRLDGLPAGVYTLKIRLGAGVLTRKLLKE